MPDVLAAGPIPQWLRPTLSSHSPRRHAALPAGHHRQLSGSSISKFFQPISSHSWRPASCPLQTSNSRGRKLSNAVRRRLNHDQPISALVYDKTREATSIPMGFSEIKPTTYCSGVREAGGRDTSMIGRCHCHGGSRHRRSFATADGTPSALARPQAEFLHCLLRLNHHGRHFSNRDAQASSA